MQILKRICCLLAASMTVAAHAGEQPSYEDVRCLLVGMRIAALPNPVQQGAGNMLAYYYFGRLEKVSPQDLEEAIVREDSKMTQAAFNSDALRCGKVLGEKGKALERIGKDLAQRAENGSRAIGKP